MFITGDPNAHVNIYQGNKLDEFCSTTNVKEVWLYTHLGITFSNSCDCSELTDNIVEGVGKCLDAMRKFKHSVDRKTQYLFNS